MSRYIDADAVKYIFTELRKSPWYHDDTNRARVIREDALDIIEHCLSDAPSIDIVRCKECKHREEYPCKVYHDDDWYCADGEREGD